jgi:hypothetical protein
LDFPAIRERVHDEFEVAQTVAERVMLLGIFKATMDAVERNLTERNQRGEESDEMLAKFRDARAKDYNMFVTKECLVGGQVSAEMLLAVTDREIAAARMTEDHPLRKLAVDACAKPHLTHAEMVAKYGNKRYADDPPAKQTVGQRLKGWFKR